jgi:hypothetical protein
LATLEQEAAALRTCNVALEKAMRTIAAQRPDIGAAILSEIDAAVRSADAASAAGSAAEWHSGKLYAHSSAELQQHCTSHPMAACHHQSHEHICTVTSTKSLALDPASVSFLSFTTLLSCRRLRFEV